MTGSTVQARKSFQPEKRMVDLEIRHRHSDKVLARSGLPGSKAAKGQQSIFATAIFAKQPAYGNNSLLPADL